MEITLDDVKDMALRNWVLERENAALRRRVAELESQNAHEVPPVEMGFPGAHAAPFIEREV